MIETFSYYLTSRLLWEFIAVFSLIAFLYDMKLRRRAKKGGRL